MALKTFTAYLSDSAKVQFICTSVTPETFLTPATSMWVSKGDIPIQTSSKDLFPEADYPKNLFPNDCSLTNVVLTQPAAEKRLSYSLKSLGDNSFSVRVMDASQNVLDHKVGDTQQLDVSYTAYFVLAPDPTAFPDYLRSNFKNDGVSWADKNKVISNGSDLVYLTNYKQSPFDDYGIPSTPYNLSLRPWTTSVELGSSHSPATGYLDKGASLKESYFYSDPRFNSSLTGNYQAVFNDESADTWRIVGNYQTSGEEPYTKFILIGYWLQKKINRGGSDMWVTQKTISNKASRVLVFMQAGGGGGGGGVYYQGSTSYTYLLSDGAGGGGGAFASLVLYLDKITTPEQCYYFRVGGGGKGGTSYSGRGESGVEGGDGGDTILFFGTETAQTALVTCGGGRGASRTYDSTLGCSAENGGAGGSVTANSGYLTYWRWLSDGRYAGGAGGNGYLRCRRDGSQAEIVKDATYSYSVASVFWDLVGKSSKPSSIGDKVSNDWLYLYGGTGGAVVDNMGGGGASLSGNGGSGNSSSSAPGYGGGGSGAPKQQAYSPASAQYGGYGTVTFWWPE